MMNIRICIWPDLKWGIEFKLFVQRYDSILFYENCVFSSLFRLFQENKTRMKKTQRGFLHIVYIVFANFFAVCSFFMNISTWFLCCDTFCFVLIITSIIIVQRSSAAFQMNKQHRQSTTE